MRVNRMCRELRKKDVLQVLWGVTFYISFFFFGKTCVVQLHTVHNFFLPPSLSVQSVLRKTHDRSLNKYASVDEEDDFQEVLDPPPVQPSTQYQLSIAFPDLSQHKVREGFFFLG